MTKRLVAVLAADVASYSRLVAEDETRALQTLAAHRAIIDGLIARSGGRIANTAGDSVLAELPSATVAVDCAVSIQNELAKAPGFERMRFRIGLHVGDATVVGNDLLGDTVNIAARLQSMAQPGGICLSEQVHGHVSRALKLDYVDLGPLKLKNIPEPVRAYAIAMEGEGEALPPALPLPDKPSIAVMPFANVSGDPKEDYFADGISEDLVNGLARIGWLFVIARNSSFAFKGQVVDTREIGRRLGVRFVLEGSVRRAADRVRITTQLVNAADGSSLWANRFDRDMSDIFELQDEITQRVVGSIEPMIRRVELERIQRKRPEDLSAYDFYLRSLALMFDITATARAQAYDFATKALAIDPGYAEAHGVAAWCQFARSLWEGSFPDKYREAAIEHGRAVQRLHSEDASTLAHGAIALAMATRDYEPSLTMIERALSFNPNSAHAYGHGSVINAWAGNHDRAIRYSEQALRLSPFDPLAVMPLAGRAGAHLRAGENESALEYASRALNVYPTHVPSFLIQIASLVKLGRQGEAEEQARRLCETSPNYRIAPTPILEHFRDALRQAGLPE